jgi:hypothetical protein
VQEDVLRELARILAAAWLRYQRVPKIREESPPEPKKELDTSPPRSPHGQ